MRGINSKFIKALKFGELSFVLKKAKLEPQNFCIEIRENYINLYYRGGSALRITQKSDGYHFKFDEKYCLDPAIKSKFDSLDKRDAMIWEEAFPQIIAEMDRWFEAHPKLEREYQQKILTNNKTDFCIVDIEYAIHKKNLNDKNGCRLDMLALHQTTEGTKLVLIEYKNGIGAMTGSASLAKHHADLLEITNNNEAFNELKSSVLNIALNKSELGLLTVKPQAITDTEVLFLISDHNEKSTKLDSQKQLMDKTLPAKIYFLPKDEFEIDYCKSEQLI